MLRSTSWCSVTIIFLVNVTVIATQVPFHPSHVEWQPAILNDEHLASGWNLNTAPNPNFTDHLVFETVHSLLQRWPNTRMRNGELSHAFVWASQEYSFCLQVMPSYQELFQREHFSTTERLTTYCQQVSNGFLPTLNIRMRYAGMIPKKNVGNSHSRQLDPSRWSISMVAVL